jgi:glucosyl-3-phosphoglycerate synthase
VRADVRRWYERRTSAASDWPLPRLLAAKGTTRVSVVLPALDEEATVGQVVATVRRELVDEVPLVDELVVVDSGSTDATARVAADAGARVEHVCSVLPGQGTRPGKGEVLWKSLAVTSGDLVVFADSDVTDFRAEFVTGLLGPLLHDPGVALVKGFYERPLRTDDGVAPAGGGRVTELVARPLLNLHWPELAGVVQPLSGEYAARRSVLEAVPFASGYGVETGLLVDVLGGWGLDALAQVDLGTRTHRNSGDAALGRMASTILQTVLGRLERSGRLVLLDEPSPALTQFPRAGAAWAPRTTDVAVWDRPPMRQVQEYVAERARTR